MELKKQFSILSMLFAMVIGLTMTACDETEDPTDGGGDGPLIEDGVYLTGDATGLEFSRTGFLNPGRAEGEGFSNALREGMTERFIYLSAGKLQIANVEGGQVFYYAKADDHQEVEPDPTTDHIQTSYFTGTLQQTEDETAGFDIVEEGVYHVILDATTNQYIYTKVESLGAIGDATELGWSGEVDLAMVDAKTFRAENVVLRTPGGVKFRYNDGWKIQRSEDFVVFSNFGFRDGALEMGDPTVKPDVDGEYTVEVAYSDETGTFGYSLTKTGDVEALDYPESLYVIGSALTGDDDGWNWDLMDSPLKAVANNNAHLFWTIVWLEEGGEFKFAPQREWNGDFGGSGDLADGKTAKGSDNITTPGASGYYMVVVDLENEEIHVSDSPEVYLIGDAIGSWDKATEAGKFMVEGEEMVFTGDLTETAELRMYASHPALTATAAWDWWTSEFIVLDGMIEYRGAGGDQDRVAVSTGNYTISLNFKSGAGSVTMNN
ncbi:SusF/SusE family outer membrane protein [Sediminitomix flava]|uniref:Uncharacterized protein DUF5019 n=1 Tax=Sediminitomix flava TaxID=379075 RepID=A0A315ZCE0_SEDFL|nr:SusF/SusE family outer membrane protein [Sediminitomix flava]PWJ42488.1 uncharacterized protein DUF5019 [Sediminitomix flava]